MVANLTSFRAPRSRRRSASGTASGTTGRRVAHLDGIRAIAVLIVVLYHATNQRLMPFTHVTGGYVGVDLFFVLSGFVITTVLAGDRRRDLTSYYRSFLAGRARRLYPALLAVLIGVTGAVWLGWRPVGPSSAAEVSTWAGMGAVQMSSLYFAFHLDSPNLLQPTWTLSVEWMFYVVWPLVVWRVRHAKRPDLVVAAAALVTYAGSLLVDSRYWWLLPPSRFAQLLAGGALAFHLLRAQDAKARPTGSVGKLLTLSGLAFLLLWSLDFDGGPIYPAYQFIAAPIATAAAIGMIRRGGGDALVGRLLRWKPLVAVGRTSYSLYLVHLPWMFVFGSTTGGTRSWAAILAATFAIGITTVAMYRLFEAPYLTRHSRSELLQPARRPT